MLLSVIDTCCNDAFSQSYTKGILSEGKISDWQAKQLNMRTLARSLVVEAICYEYQ